VPCCISVRLRRNIISVNADDFIECPEPCSL
jgi:hypothetical protein